MRIACPKCDFSPSPKTLWRCHPGCGYKWHTFATHGVCPRCSKMWHDTQCPHCKWWSPIDDWYHDDIPERLASLREVQSPKGMISASGEELSALSPSGRHAVPSVLDKAFNGAWSRFTAPRISTSITDQGACK